MKIRQYVKKPIPVEAMQYTGDMMNFFDLQQFCGKILVPYLMNDKADLQLDTLEGRFNFSVGDYVLKGPEGEFWSVKKKIFEKTYEELAEQLPVEPPKAVPFRDRIVKYHADWGHFWATKKEIEMNGRMEALPPFPQLACDADQHIFENAMQVEFSRLNPGAPVPTMNGLYNLYKRS